MNSTKNPAWWTKETDSGWDNVKAALKRDWDQTKHDFGGNTPNTNQKIGNTIRQAEGTEGIPPRGLLTYDELEPAVRFGYGAKAVYGEEYLYWDDELEARLLTDWEKVEPARKQTWMQDRAAMRYAWEYET
ncbi:MAG TPA: hypothetical protein VG347_24340 [Verrucomicrobiae bacterium]|nr:hypothetical protein [Verrucomicrobiae bacterium]